MAPEALALNSVVALPEGGFATTSPRTGDVWEWSTDAGWSHVPGSEDIGPNGLEISRDGEWFYVGGYGAQSLIRLSRGQTPVQTDAVEVGFHIDNVRWGPGETLFAAGHLGPTRAAIGECIHQRQCDNVTALISEGGMCHVWQATQTQLDREVWTPEEGLYEFTGRVKYDRLLSRVVFYGRCW